MKDTHTYVHLHMRARVLLLFVRQCFSLNPALTDLAGLVASKPQGSSWVHLLTTGITGVGLAFYLCPGALNSGPQPYMASMSPTEPSSLRHMSHCCLQGHHCVVTACLVNLTWLEVFFISLFTRHLMAWRFAVCDAELHICPCATSGTAPQDPPPDLLLPRVVCVSQDFKGLVTELPPNPMSSPSSGATSCAGHGKGHQRL